MMRVLDLFSGVGGFSLGLERTGGFQTVAFCEIEVFPRSVLARHWPGVPCYDDVRTLTAAQLAADGIGVDVICGGFPCQDISNAGAGVGLDGARSGLWWQFHRIIAEVRPAWVVIENVAALRGRGLDRVLGALAALGYDAEWHCIPAAAIGAPHRRDRIWIIAYSTWSRRGRVEPGGGSLRGDTDAGRDGAGQPVADADRNHGRARRPGRSAPGCSREHQSDRTLQSSDVADADRERTELPKTEQREANRPHPQAADMSGGCSADVADADDRRHGRTEGSIRARRDGALVGSQHMAQPGEPGLPLSQRPPVLGARWREAGAAATGGGGWPAQSGLGRGTNGLPAGLDGSLNAWGEGWEDGLPRVAHGVPRRVDRLKALGNAVVPQIPEAIGYAILAAA